MEDNIQKGGHQKDIDIDSNILDHDYDGIRELDNPAPRWIMAIFYITIAFSIIYGAYYFFLGVGDDQDTQYAKKSMQHDTKYQLSNQSTGELALLTAEADIAEGQAVYTSMNCFACHGLIGEGNAIGPNLTDEYWIHGGDFQSIFDIIKNGVPAKGMTPFKGQISDSKIQKVASYIVSLKGTNPANAREPQGEKVE